MVCTVFMESVSSVGVRSRAILSVNQSPAKLHDLFETAFAAIYEAVKMIPHRRVGDEAMDASGAGDASAASTGGAQFSMLSDLTIRSTEDSEIENDRIRGRRGGQSTHSRYQLYQQQPEQMTDRQFESMKNVVRDCVQCPMPAACVQCVVLVVLVPWRGIFCMYCKLY